jgi:hypothetical protein
MMVMAATHATQHQHSADMTVMSPTTVATEATLVAARQLLNNPSPSHASPLVAEQWCHDIDQLVITAINMPPHGGWQQPSAAHSRMLIAVHTPSVARAPSAAHGPGRPHLLIGSIATANLTDELNHHREGEDNLITIECQRERHGNLEGRNLKWDFGSLAPTKEAPVPRATHTPSSPGATSGCMALAPHLRMVVWLHKFRPHLPEKYDGTVNPIEFL